MGERVVAVTWSGLYGEPYREVADGSEHISNGGVSAFHIERSDRTINSSGRAAYIVSRAGYVIHSV